MGQRVSRVLWSRVQSQRDGGPVRGPQCGRPWRKVKVTERRTTQDYARRLRELVDIDYPEAERMQVGRAGHPVNAHAWSTLLDLSGPGGAADPAPPGVR